MAAEKKQNLDSLSKIRDQYLHLTSQIEQWQQRQMDFNKRKQQFTDQIVSIKKVQKALSKLKSDLTQFDTVKSTKDKLDAESTKYALQQAKLQEKTRLNEMIHKKQLHLKNETDALASSKNIQQKIDDIEKKSLQTEQQQESIRQELTQVQGELQKIKALGEEIKQRKQNVEHIGKESPCPVCTRPLGEHYNDVMKHFDDELSSLRNQWKRSSETEQDYTKKLATINSDLKIMKQTRDDVLREQEKYKERKKSFDQLTTELKDWEAKLKNRVDEIDALGKIDYDETKHQRIKTEHERLSKLYEKALQYEEQIKQLPNVQDELNQTEQILKDISTDLASHHEKVTQLDFNEQKYTEIKKEVEQLQQHIDDAREKYEQIQREVLLLKKDQEKIDGDIQNQRKLVSEVKQIEDDVHYLTLLDQHFGSFRQELAGRIRPLIAQRTSDLLRLTTNSRYSMLDLDKDYNIYLYDQMQRYPLARFSGGEQDLANLCLRIAISQVVAERAGGSQINFIVLDEIFGSQDTSRKELIMNTLQHLSSQFRQIFVITHVEEIKDIMPVIVSIEEKSVGESEAVLI